MSETAAADSESTSQSTIVRHCAIRVADVTLAIEACDEDLRLEIQPRYLPFMTDVGDADTVLRVHYAVAPWIGELDPSRRLFDSGDAWQLYEHDDGYIMTLTLAPYDRDSETQPSEAVMFDRTFSVGDLYVRPRGVGEVRSHPDGTMSMFPMHRPLDELLLVNRIALLGGLLVHGCAVKVGGAARLFTGKSGAGKSTIARLWQAQGASVLSDERVVIRRQDDGLIAYGTPWWSSAKASLPESAPLAGVHFLKHSPDNFLTRVPPSQALGRILHSCFPTFYLKAGMDNTLGLLTEMLSSVPAYEFSFRDDESAVEHLLEAWK